MFDAFGVMRSVRDDASLSTAEKAFLLCAVLRTNERGRVRASQQMLATDAGLSLSTVKRIYRDGLIGRFFLSTKTGRQLNLTWKPIGVMVTPERCQGDTPSTSIYSSPSTTYLPSSSIGEQRIAEAEAEAEAALLALQKRLGC